MGNTEAATSTGLSPFSTLINLQFSVQQHERERGRIEKERVVIESPIRRRQV